jgi:tryptophan synthase beta chain
VIEEAKKAKEEGKEKVILVNWSGHGLIDLGSYDKYFAGELKNHTLTDDEMLASEKVFANYPKPALLKSR